MLLVLSHFRLPPSGACKLNIAKRCISAPSLRSVFAFTPSRHYSLLNSPCLLIAAWICGTSFPSLQVAARIVPRSPFSAPLLCSTLIFCRHALAFSLIHGPYVQDTAGIYPRSSMHSFCFQCTVFVLRRDRLSQNATPFSCSILEHVFNPLEHILLHDRIVVSIPNFRSP